MAKRYSSAKSGIFRARFPQQAVLRRRRWIGTVVVASGTTITPGTGSLVLTGYAPVLDLGITPSTGTLTLTGYAPVLNLGLTPSTASLTLTGFSPTVVVNTPLVPGAASLTLTGYALVLDLGLTPGAGSLTLTGYAPNVTATANIAVTPDTATLTLTGYAPDVAAAGSASVTPDTASLVLTGYAPTVTATETAATPPVRRVVVHPPKRRHALAGEVYGDTYTDPARILCSPHVAANTDATAYTEPAAGYILAGEHARVRIHAQLAGEAWDTGEFSASAELVDHDVEALFALGVL